MYCDDKTRVFCVNTKNNNTPIHKNHANSFLGIQKITQLLAEFIFILNERKYQQFLYSNKLL